MASLPPVSRPLRLTLRWNGPPHCLPDPPQPRHGLAVDLGDGLRLCEQTRSAAAPPGAGGRELTDDTRIHQQSLDRFTGHGSPLQPPLHASFVPIDRLVARRLHWTSFLVLPWPPFCCTPQLAIGRFGRGRRKGGQGRVVTKDFKRVRRRSSRGEDGHNRVGWRVTRQRCSR